MKPSKLFNHLTDERDQLFKLWIEAFNLHHLLLDAYVNKNTERLRQMVKKSFNRYQRRYFSYKSLDRVISMMGDDLK